MTEQRFKVIFLGDTGVGKTSIIRNRINEPFNYKMQPTVGSNYEMTEVKINNELVKLRIWDTAGQEQYQSIMPVYLRGSQIAVIVGSITDHLSISDIDNWVSIVQENEPSCTIIVAINKVDLENDVNKLNDLRLDLHEKYKNMCFVSARTGSGINDLFVSVARGGLEAYGNPKDDKESVNINAGTQKTKCC